MNLATKEFRYQVSSIVFDGIKAVDESIRSQDLYALVVDKLNLSKENQEKRYLKSGQIIYKNAVLFVVLALEKMGLIKRVQRGVYKMTEQGREKPELDIKEYKSFQKKYRREQSKASREKDDRLPLFGISQTSEIRKNLTEKEIELLTDIVKQNDMIINEVLKNS